MHSVYCYSANINPGRIDNEESDTYQLSPPIILVGTNRNSFSIPTKKTIVIIRTNF